MKIKTRVTFREYVRLLFGLTYRRPIMMILVAVDLLLLLWILFYCLDIFNLPEPLIYQYATLILITVVQPTVVYTIIHRVYYSSNHICEPLEMEILPREIKIHGKSFYMEVRWDKMFKIVEKPKWFLIYHNSLSAIIIPKNDLRKSEVLEFKKILGKLENTRVELLAN